jgi:hypothetical protein
MLGRTKRKVRYYIDEGPTIEGIEAGRTRSDYIVWAPRIINGDPDPGTVSSHEESVVVSGHVEIERSKVLWRQVVG